MGERRYVDDERMHLRHPLARNPGAKLHSGVYAIYMNTMMKQTLSVVAVLAMSMSIGCGKDEAKDSKGGEGKPAAADYAGADLADDANVCCEFGGAVGTSNK